jgi:hypothetical protein
MRRLTYEERIALRTIGPPNEGPVSQATFGELERLGWGRWGDDGYWVVTEAGTTALRLDDIALRHC